jgi:ADP-heptose:LPS heptosyltransferase
MPMKHGVVTPNMAKRTPGRVINVQSRVNTESSQIRLDRLLKAARPEVCIKRRLGGIGDVLMSTPVLRHIKKLLPDCYLAYATDLEYSQGALADIIRHNPYVDELVSWKESTGRRWDYTSDITATGLKDERPGMVPPSRIDLFADQIGIDVSSDPLPTYIVWDEERSWAKRQLKKYKTKSTKNVITIQARSNDARRSWPLSHVEKLVNLLTENEDNIVLLFDWGDKAGQWKDKSWEHEERVFIIIDMHLPQVAAMLEQCTVLVCPDSAMLHLAGALQKKTVAIFGPVPPESRINYYPNATAVTLNLPCQYCWYSPQCTKYAGSKLACLHDISPKMIKEAVVKKIAEAEVVRNVVKYGRDISRGRQDPIILVKRATSGIGDILMAIPSIEALKQRYPDKQIHLAIQKSLWPVVINNPNIEQILDVTAPINYRRYYMAMDISTPCAQYESARVVAGRPVEKSRVEVFAEAMGVRKNLASLTPKYYITKEEIEWAKDFMKRAIPKDYTGQPKIAVTLKSAEVYRDWPPKYYAELFELMKPHILPIILDQARDHFFENTVDACGFSLRHAISILNQCDGLISVDSGMLHVAAALDIPTVALFGPIDFRARCKGYKDITAVNSNLDCQPCWRNSHIPCKKTGKVKGYSKCMQVLTAKKIAEICKNKFL